MRRGYTLFELLIVMALIVLFAGLSVPPIEAMYADYRITSAVDQVRTRWSAMRTRAITEGRPYRFGVAPGGGDYRAAPDRPEYWAGGDPPATDSDSAPLVVQDSLPRGIVFAAGEGGATDGAWTTAAVFLPDGTAREDAEIVFRSHDANPIALRLRALTGGVTSRRLPPDGGR